MLTEPEILSQHREQLRIAQECCGRLRHNAIELVPRGIAYAELRDALKKLEGTCRQMFHWRGDDPRWLRLGAVYARAQKLAQRYLIREEWLRFGELAQLFELGLRRLDDLGDRPTGRAGGKLILPGAIDRWFEARSPLLQ